MGTNNRIIYYFEWWYISELFKIREYADCKLHIRNEINGNKDNVYLLVLSVFLKK